ncbi:polysaccharide deacetylase family protein [Micromonospora halophytica]|uniref:Peptidoglycan/xylan/chitin deacetylase, PgdA/CDA1 family n=1 Tax=Micromonospora halophytica TaxID=47864 RepID=A0A1C5JB26_9ACTN|nr:polysaccharide deacetylase family protein [Micromonospora halophytica]SCG67728.1 Peptidoglycan/xylan/chitin deacetylase, PgdA/CDA1 family [Micromonospora halophytica]
MFSTAPPRGPRRRAGTAAATVRIVDTVPGRGKLVSLTFDDGPDPVHTPRLLDVLGAHEVPAVFFVCGEQVDRCPDVVRRIVEEGHVLGNHGTCHDDMARWPAERVEADLRGTHAAIMRAVPDAPVPWFRAPYGAWGGTPAVAAGLGMTSVGWRLAVTDWEPPGVGELVRRLCDGVRPGAVVLLHDGGGDRSQTVEAVARVVPLLRARRWRFVLPDGGAGRVGGRS